MNKKDLDKNLLSCIERKKTFLDDLKKIDVDKNWIRFQNTISRNTHLVPEYSFIQRNRLLLSRIAAAALILIASTTTLYLANHRSVHHIQQVNSLFKNTEVHLSDGSIILLNKGSILNYPEKLNRKNREVSISGEAFFEITKNSAAPFYVYISNTTVKVIGTSFNIKEEEGNKIIVSVMSGEVAFYESANENNVIRLETGQQGIFDNRTGSFGHGALISDNFLYWKTNNLSFNYETLALVFEELEKCFHTSIVVEDSTILKNRLTTICEGQQLIPILDELTILFDIKYSIKGDSVFVQRKHQ